jgi:hypothetical protein
MPDERDINLPPSDLSILAGVHDENQRTLLKQTMESSAYKLSELVARADELERENRALLAKGPEAERAIAAAEKANEKLKAAEDARSAAKRIAEKERFARISAEEARDELLVDLRQANESKSRIEHLLEKHDVEL